MPEQKQCHHGLSRVPMSIHPYLKCWKSARRVHDCALRPVFGPNGDYKYPGRAWTVRSRHINATILEASVCLLDYAQHTEAQWHTHTHTHTHRATHFHWFSLALSANRSAQVMEQETTGDYGWARGVLEVQRKNVSQGQVVLYTSVILQYGERGPESCFQILL